MKASNSVEYLSYEKHFSKAPFDKAFDNKFIFKIFSNFVLDCNGFHFIECWNLLQEYKLNPKFVIEKLLKFIENHIHDPLKRDEMIKIIRKEKQIDFDSLFDYVKKILKNEYFPRFLNSKSIKLYSIINCIEVEDMTNRFRSKEEKKNEKKKINLKYYGII